MVLVTGMPKPDREQLSALRVGAMILAGFAGFIILIWVLGYLHGTVGRTFSLITGFLWTPTIMEPTLFLLGLFTILILNHHRRQKDGPELVYLESVIGPDAQNLPEHSRSATFVEKPQPPSGDDMIATIEGALELNDLKQFSRLLLELPPEALESEGAIAIRLRLARNNHDPNNIRGLTKKLRTINPDHPLLKEAS